MTKFQTDPDPLEVPPKPAPHQCEVAVWYASRGGRYAMEGQYLWRAAGTLWRCPECWRWWVSRATTTLHTSIEWHRVWPLTPSWFRAKRAERELR